MESLNAYVSIVVEEKVHMAKIRYLTYVLVIMRFASFPSLHYLQIACIYKYERRRPGRVCYMQ